MGNPDEGKTINRIAESTAIPKRSLVDAQDFLFYEYAELLQPGGKELASQIMNQEMRTWLEEQGYNVLDNSSQQATDFVASLRDQINQRLAPLEVRALVDIGSLVMQERIDNSPRRIMNVICAVVQNRRSENYLLIHPVEVDTNGQLQIAAQHRQEGTFAPSVMIIDPDWPFGYRPEDFGKEITSYPLEPIS